MKKIFLTLALVFVMLTSGTSVFAFGNPPVVNILNPPSTSYSNPSIYGTQPLLVWSQTDPDPGTVFDQYWVLVYDSNFNVIYNSGVVVQATSAVTANHNIAQTLPRNETLAVSVNVWDNTGNSSISKLNYFRIQ